MSKTIEEDFVQKVMEEARLFDNFSIITAKIQREGYLTRLSSLFSEIFSNELKFALDGKFKKKSKA